MAAFIRSFVINALGGAMGIGVVVALDVFDAPLWAWFLALVLAYTIAKLPDAPDGVAGDQPDK